MVERAIGEQARSAEVRRYYSLNRRVYAVFATFYDAVVFPLRALRREVARLVDPSARSRIPLHGVATVVVARRTGATR